MHDSLNSHHYKPHGHDQSCNRGKDINARSRKKSADVHGSIRLLLKSIVAAGPQFYSADFRQSNIFGGDGQFRRLGSNLDTNITIGKDAESLQKIWNRKLIAQKSRRLVVAF